MRVNYSNYYAQPSGLSLDTQDVDNFLITKIKKKVLGIEAPIFSMQKGS